MAVSRRITLLVGGLLLIGILLPATIPVPAEADTQARVFFPVVHHGFSPSPFGIEAYSSTLIRPDVYPRLEQLGAKWLRVNTVSWRDVQPNRYDPYNWSALSTFEAELRAADRAGLTPIVVVDDSPAWATINVPYPTSCGAVRQDRFADFAAFMAALVSRYKEPPYNVHYWELGNEPDVDPSIVGPNSEFGCWGNKHDFYYGGEHYGRMLMAVTPAIRQVDPGAKVLIGGLLLHSTNSNTPDVGKPERFLEGILRAGAAPHFDIVPYHAHYAYNDGPIGYDGTDASWAVYGQLATFKPAFLRHVMSRYGVSKPLFLNEGSLTCPHYNPICTAPGPAFFEAQADHVPRMIVPTISAGVKAIVWYTLDGPGWNNSALLGAHQQPRPAFIAYQQLIEQTEDSFLPPPPVSYGAGLEAFRFVQRAKVVDVVWSIDLTPETVSIPQASFIAAYQRDGSPIEPSRDQSNVYISVGYSAVYIHRRP